MGKDEEHLAENRADVLKFVVLEILQHKGGHGRDNANEKVRAR